MRLGERRQPRLAGLQDRVDQVLTRFASRSSRGRSHSPHRVWTEGAIVRRMSGSNIGSTHFEAIESAR
jgi:hypothetical protein